jgi:hypothetical protein
MHKREFDRAIQDYDQALRLNSRSATATYNRALTYRLKGDYGRSISGYDESLLLTPTDPDSFYGRGLAYAHEGDYGRAIQDYDQVLRINPSLTDVFHDRSSAYAHEGEYLQAMADYGRWRGILGITLLCLSLVAFALGISEWFRDVGHQNVQLKRFTGWMFASSSAGYVSVALRSMSNTIHQRSAFPLLAGPVFLLFVAYVCGIAWWTIWRGKASAKGFGIAASLMHILIFVRQFIPPSRPTWDYHASTLVVGILGLLVFLRQDWPPVRQKREEQAHFTSLFADESSGSRAAKQVD